MDQERVFIKYDEENSSLIIEVSPKVAFSIMKMFRQDDDLQIYMLSMEMEVLDVTSSSGIIYNNVRRYSFKVPEDRVEKYFIAARKVFTKNIMESVISTDN